MTRAEKPKWLLVKRGLYYRPNSHGYTGVKDDAGRFDKAYAEHHCQDSDVTMICEDEAPAYTKACWPEVIADHAARKTAELMAEIERLNDLRISAAVRVALVSEPLCDYARGAYCAPSRERADELTKHLREALRLLSANAEMEPAQ